jgi:hypothetical protein
VIYSQGDNGASAEGAEQGLLNEMAIGCGTCQMLFDNGFYQE